MIRKDGRQTSRNWSILIIAFAVVAIGSIVTILSTTDSWAVDALGIVWPDAGKTAHISGDFKGAQIRVRISSRTAGAIDSISWRGKEFVDRFDHGREFQTASFFGRTKRACLNPTEAGSNVDGRGPTSTTLLKSLEMKGNHLRTRALLAYWFDPNGRMCNRDTAEDKSVLSNDSLTKELEVGAIGIPNLIRYEAIFGVPEQRVLGGFETIAGYMPEEFSKFWTFDPATDVLKPADESVAKQKLPLIFSTEDEKFALGIYSPVGEPGSSHPIFGQNRFTESSRRIGRSVKWNCYFEKHDVEAGEHAFTCYMAIGELADVRKGLHSVCRKLEPQRCR